MTYYDHYLKQSGEKYENLTSGQTFPCECGHNVDKNDDGNTVLTKAVAEAKSKRKNIFVLHKP